MLRSSVLILYLSCPFLEENLRDIPIFFSFFPARSFGIELEYNGGVLRKIPEICLRFSGSAHFSKRGKAEKTEDLQPKFCLKLSYTKQISELNST